ncbi:hypothetical protein Tlie_0615 [Thermovirga lienii DSM 17291]|uniref:Lipopolysaccharide assembly protein A domain-containing protein n=1 Tax=Thermovirga lienii (strain ATCC BAA-1197 / DSM 17291 / Cas60314) TaxID=580340 RepID=G7V8Q9_THELD|nr:LapA family protein [Thermovirga lienii]AER66350.1 hypothetical protein Tlie_0615 [Thermovirga lienii DSM 17291]
MRSYALAIAVAMLVSALYAFQNSQEVLVKFFSWERTLPQGVWEVLIFAAGGVLMWLVSLFALMESRAKLVKQLKEKDKRIKELETEKESLIRAIGETKKTYGLGEEPSSKVDPAAKDETQQVENEIKKEE